MVNNDRQDLNYEKIDVSKFCKEHILEASCIKIKVLYKFRKCVYVIGLYRPPKIENFDEFIELLFEILLSINNNEDIIIITGDFNIDLSQYSKQTNSKREINDILSCHNIKFVISDATRVTDKTSTCIDNIGITSNSCAYVSNTIKCSISDHYAVSIKCLLKNEKPKCTYLYSRDLSDENISLLNYQLSRENWEEVLINDDTNSATEKFVETLNFYFNLICVKKKCKMRDGKKRKKNSIGTNPLVKLAKENMELAFEIFRLNPGTPDLLQTANNLRREYHSILKKATIEQNGNFLTSSQNMSRDSWKLINSNKNTKSKSNDYIELNVNGKTISKYEEVVNSLNEYFVNIPTKILPRVQDKLEITSPRNNASMYLDPVLPSELHKIFSNLSNKKSSGLDEISDAVLKKIGENLVTPLVHIINLSFQSGIFPDCLKYSKVIALYKEKGDKSLPDNQRPLTLSLNIAKVYEKCYYNRLSKFASTNNIIAKEQFGFQKGLSTSHATAFAVELITDALNSNQKVLGLFLDMSKAFDCVDHQKLIEILDHYGVRGVPNTWIKSYLRERKQCVSLKKLRYDTIHTYLSNFLTTLFGVPQGSILGPLLFLIYINELKYFILTRSNGNCKPVFYADDANLIITAETTGALEISASSILRDVIDFLSKLNLICNVSKTNCLHFTLKNKIDSQKISLQIDNSNIQEDEFVKFLGLYLDKNLNWSVHLDELTKKLRSSIFLLRQLSQCLPLKLLRNVYYATFFSHMSYGLLSWGSAASFRIAKIFRLQKRAVRVIANLPFDASCRTIFKASKILTLPSLYIFLRVLYAKNSNSITINSDIHSHDTRKKNDIHTKFYKGDFGRHDALNEGSIFLNRLPPSIKNILDTKIFKRTLKNYLMEKELYLISDL